MTQWSFSASTPLIALVALIWMASAWVSWTHWRRRRLPGVAALEALRFLIMALIGVTLLRPEFVRRTMQTEQPEIVILSDASESMKTRDVVVDSSTVVTRDKWVEERRQTNSWRSLEKNAKVLIEEFARPATNASGGGDDLGTDLNQALEAVLQRQKHLKAVLLLSDGDWNLGSSPLNAAARYRGQKVPLYTVAVGSENALPDLILQEVTAPSYGLLGEQISLPFKIQSHLPRESALRKYRYSQRGVESTISTFSFSVRMETRKVWSLLSSRYSSG